MSEEKPQSNKIYRKVYILSDPGLIYPFIPGTVSSFIVKKGDEVVKGDQLFILDAMKMNNIVLAPIDGVVKKINVKVGEKVSKNDVIMEIV
ncbi:MAG: biotin/lipoyl-containing protein [Bacteroidales bacterium]|nr:biotin/lipoyl-containing protein [Bacteroidales bacterium]